MNIEQIVSPFHSQNDLKDICKFNSSLLNFWPNENGWAFLWALCGVESDYGSYDVPRFEAAYGPGGLYFKKSRVVRDLYSKYGALASCSYGAGQILYVVAQEMGYSKNPLCLWSASESIPLIVKYLNRLIEKGARNIIELSHAYNGGPGALRRPIEDVIVYGKKFTTEYLRHKSTLINR